MALARVPKGTEKHLSRDRILPSSLGAKHGLIGHSCDLKREIDRNQLHVGLNNEDSPKIDSIGDRHSKPPVFFPAKGFVESAFERLDEQAQLGGTPPVLIAGVRAASERTAPYSASLLPGSQR